MTVFLLATSIAAELLAALAVAFSIRFPERRIWPPVGAATVKSALMGFLFFYPALGIGILGLDGWEDLVFPLWLRVGLGLPFLLAGMILFLWAWRLLGMKAMMGGDGNLIVTGPFRITRNPQYTGCLIMLAGWAILTGSPAAALASLFAFPPLILVPFAEEPWLRARFGPAYDEYMKRVPRFLGIRLNGK